MSISDNVVTEMPNLMGQLIQIFIDFISIFIESWVLMLFIFSIFVTMILIWKITVHRINEV